MILTDLQRAKLESFAKSEHASLLIDLVDDYILDLKDAVLDEKLDPKAGKQAILKLQEFKNKCFLVSGSETKPVKNQFV